MFSKLSHTATSAAVVILFSMVGALPASEAGAESAQATARADAPEPPPGAKPYTPRSRDDDGRCLALTVEKLQRGFSPPRPLLIWAIGSSYTNKLGSGDELIELVRRRWPSGPEIVYKKMVGNAVPWQYLPGWARHLVIPDQPDLVLIYTLGEPADLERLIVELRRATTADIVVPTLHWRVPDRQFWDDDPDKPYWDEVRRICHRHEVELVENRRDWGDYLRDNGLPIESLLADNVHQSAYGAHIVRTNIAAHLVPHPAPASDPRNREQRIEVEQGHQAIKAIGAWRRSGGTLEASAGARLQIAFHGRGIDLIGVRRPVAGRVRVLIDGQPAEALSLCFATYVQPDRTNYQSTDRPDPARDKSPHGVLLGPKPLAQQWIITMISDTGDYELVGSVTGQDGQGNSSRPFTSRSGQITIEPELWRRAEGNRRGDRWTFEVYAAAVGQVDFSGSDEEIFRVRLARQLPPGEHTVELVVEGEGSVRIDAIDVFAPPER